jgi:hypothetical protein
MDTGVAQEPVNIRKYRERLTAVAVALADAPETELNAELPEIHNLRAQAS